MNYKNYEKSIISFACGSTYNLVEKTGIHAHPVKRGFPNLDSVPRYLMIRAKGGISHKLYEVETTIEFNPLSLIDREKYKNQKYYERLENYIVERASSRFGFNRAPIPYRYYILKPVYVFDPFFDLGRNPQGYIFLSFDDLNIDSSMITNTSIK